MKKLLTFSILLTLAYIGLYSLEADISFELNKPEEIYIGTPIHLRVTIKTNSEFDVYHPVKDTVDVFSIIKIDKSDPTKSPDRSVRTFDYVFAPFETGEQRFPPLTFNVYDPDKGNMEILRTDPIKLFVISVLSDSTDTIKDIKSLLKLSLTKWDYLFIVLVVLVAGALIYLLIRFLLKKPVIDTSEEEIDIRPAHLRALELLEALKVRGLLEEGNYLEFFYQLSYILRFFIENYYHFNAVEMTTSEIKEALRDSNSASLQDKENEVILEFLSFTDLVKFAKYPPTLNHSLAKLEWLESFLKGFNIRQSVIETEESIKKAEQSRV